MHHGQWRFYHPNTFVYLCNKDKFKFLSSVLFFQHHFYSTSNLLVTSSCSQILHTRLLDIQGTLTPGYP
ncbi:hypothetical protein XENTR_v10008303 [Xenopus tropicalis]|nr:hypothetical protein XENTR_v10008303 [Xenopus tropicalis]